MDISRNGAHAQTRRAGPATALKLGALAGFATAFPVNFSIATWVPVSRAVPMWWTIDFWVGAIVATFIAAWLYKD